MREILFRGKRIDNGEWVEGAYYKRTHFYGDPSEKHYIIVSSEDLGYDQAVEYFEVDPATVGQYTGLTDKNGERIWEGDECRVKRLCILAYGRIEFDKGCFWFSDDGEGGKLRLCDIAMNGFTIEVLDGGDGDGR